MQIKTGHNSSNWWGEYEIPAEMGAHWQLGPLDLIAEHRAHELRFSSRVGKDPRNVRIEINCPMDNVAHTDESTLVRFALANPQTRLILEPRLADRAVIVRPADPFWVTGNQTVNLYLNTPIWVLVRAQGIDAPLLDLPSIGLSDSWFGSTRQAGEVCYASRTQARLDPDKLHSHPMRATTRLVIHNKLPDPLLVERVKLPTRYLALFETDQGHLWTQAVHVKRTQRNEGVTLRLEKPKALQETGVSQLSGPREKEESTFLKRALDALIG